MTTTMRIDRLLANMGYGSRREIAALVAGDRITLDVPKRKIELLVPAAELATRKKAWKAPPPHPGSDRGYTGLFFKTVLQADEGVDFDFLGPAKS